MNYWLKPIGHSSAPIKRGDLFDDNYKVHFSLKRPTGVVIGDILICYANGNGIGEFLSIFEVTSEPKFMTKDHDEYCSWTERWPWYVEVKCLSKKLGNEWWAYGFRLRKFYNHYLKTNPSAAVLFNGSQELVLRGDKFKISEQFAKYIINTIESLTK